MILWMVAKSISHHFETMVEPITFVGIYVGESNHSLGCLNGARSGFRNHPHELSKKAMAMRLDHLQRGGGWL